MNPYPHHASLAGSPHHHPAGGEPHHGYGSSTSGSAGTATTPDPSPHSPAYGAGPQDAGPQGYPQSQQSQQQQQQQQGMSSNGHHHAAAAAAAAAQAMMQQQQQQQAEQQQQQQQQQRSYQQHPHLPAHMAGYPPVNHNNNCTLKESGLQPGPPNLSPCFGCGKPILDRYLLSALDRYWHNQCLRCNFCQQNLAETGSGKCYSKNGMILCREDYVRMFCTGACAGCGQTIAATELITRSGSSIYHTKCFTCTKCSAPLQAGDRYYMLQGQVTCEQDWNKYVKTTSLAAQAAAAGTGNGGLPTRKGKVGRPRRSRE